MEQILAAAHLSHLLPVATDWVYDNGCSASDMTESLAEELASALNLRRLPSNRFIKAVQHAIQNETLIDDEFVDPCWSVKAEPSDTAPESEQIDSDQDLPAPSPSAAPCASAPPLPALLPGQTTLDQVWCEVHGKWRDHSKMVRNSTGEARCAEGHLCLGGRRSRRDAPARSPLSPRKRSRPWTGEDISSHIAGLGRYPHKSQGLRREDDGSFSLDAVMSFWGFNAGLSTAMVQSAIQEHLFKKPRHGETPVLRFSVSQGPVRRDPVMIKVAPCSRS